MDDTVALVRHEGDLGASSRAKTLAKALDLIGGFGNTRSPFIIKPNVCTNPLWDLTRFSTVSPKMVEALVDLALREDQEISIRIVESDSMDKFADEFTWKIFGYKDLEERLRESGSDVSLVNLSQQPLVKVKFDGQYFKELELHKLLTGPKYFVSVALAKTHSITFVTGIIKNQFGLLPRKRKVFYHPSDDAIDLNDVIVDLTRFVRPDLCIVDAIVGLEGVTHGRPRRVNALVVGKMPVSVDATMARLMGFEPEKIHHLVEAEKNGLGTLNPKVVGESLESMVVKFEPPANLRSIALTKTLP